MHVDASGDGLGAILYQEDQDKKLRVVAYASRTLTQAEQNYHFHSGKFLALKWAITERFRDYLYYAPHFTVFSDNNPLSYILTTPKLDVTRLRWVGELSDFQFTLKYKPGSLNRDADGLSRMPTNFSSFMLSCTEESDPTEIQALVQMIIMRDYGKLPFLPTIVSAATVSMDDNYLQTIPGESLKKIPKEDLKIEQEEDSDIGEVKKLVESGEKSVHKVRKSLTPPGRHLVRAWSKLMVGEDGILWRTVRQPSGEICHQIILPKKYRPIVMEELHVNMGHLGAEKVTTLAQGRFYWPNMSSNIEHFVRHQ